MDIWKIPPSVLFSWNLGSLYHVFPTISIWLFGRFLVELAPLKNRGINCHFLPDFLILSSHIEKFDPFPAFFT